MQTLTLQDIKSKGSKAIPSQGPTYLIVNSKPSAVIVPFEEYEDMVQTIEDLEDAIIYEERKDGDYVTLEEIKEELRK